MILALLLGSATVALARPQPLPPPGPTTAAGKRARRHISRFQLWRAGIAAERQARRQRRQLTKPSFKRRLASLIAGGVALSILAAPPAGIAGQQAAPQTAQPTTHERRLAAQPGGIKNGVVTVQTADGPRQYRVLPAEKGQVDLVGAMRSALVKLARDQVYKEHSITVGDVELGDHASIGFKLTAKPVARDDGLITGNAYSAALTKRMKDAGKPVSWVQIGGGIFPAGGFTVPLGSGYVGFSADAMVGYSVLAPYQHKLQAVGEAGKNLTTKLPVTWSKAQALQDGTLVQLVGRARYAVQGGAGTGQTLATIGDLATIGAHAGVGASRVKEGIVKLEIQKRGEQVYVRVTEIASKNLSGWMGAQIGVDAHVARGLPSADNAAAKKALEAVYGQVDRTLEKYLKAGFRVSDSAGTGEQVIAAYSFSGKGRDVARAYEELIRFSPDGANRMVGRGVAQARLGETKHTTSSGPRAYVGPWDIISEISSSTLRHGTLGSRDGELTYDRAKLADGSTGIVPALWKGKRQVTREYVTVKYPGQEDRQTYLRVHHTVEKDRFTTKSDVRRFKNLADFLGAVRQGEDYKAKKLGKTDRVVDVYITDAGLKKLAAAKPAELLKAYSEAYKKIDRPWDMDYLIGGNKGVWKENPWMVKDHPRHNDVIRWLELGPEPVKTSNAKAKHAGPTRQSSYRFVTGRDLASDSAAYKEGKLLVKLIEQLGSAGSPAERARIFAEADRDLRLDFWKKLATLSIVAGRDQVLVNKLAIHGEKQRSITYLHEGAIRDPQGVIDARLQHP